MEGGRCLFEAHEEAVQQAASQCVFFEVSKRADGWPYRLAVFQDRATGFRLSADVAEYLRQAAPAIKVDVVAGFYFIVDKSGDPPRLYFSLRGLNGFDVCELAKANGGGGHTAAAAFSVPHALTAVLSVNPYRFIRERLAEFLP
jgi:nanoRNase/pAp phosphatase (c-di-AMP/oligoRNAs hydrolase)